jgi:hypothetical protein
MSESNFAADTIVPPSSEPTCCPDAYLCLTADVPEIECPHHGGFDVCCAWPELHIPQNRDAWHQRMSHWEQDLLNRHIQRFKILQAYELVDDSVMSTTLRTLI